MKSKRRSAQIQKYMFHWGFWLGVVILMGVFWFAAQLDMNATQRHLSATVSYIKEQCNQYNRLNLASETKSLMRIMESARQTERQLAYEKTQNHTLVPEARLEKCVQDNYVSGLILLDKNGRVQKEYSMAEYSAKDLSGQLTSDVLLNTAYNTKKTYAVRIEANGDYIDLAAVGNSDDSGIVVVYYVTPEEYINTFSLTIDSLLSGYSVEHDGTIAVCRGENIVASNDASLIGKSTSDIEILRKIKNNAHSDQLVHAKRSEASIGQNFGLMEHGRDYYVYAYMPENNVFDSTLQNVFYTLIVYLIILTAVHMVRWRTAQRYREKQLKIQKEYTESLQDKNEQLEKAVDQADRANAAKTSFLSRMSHDIRTPLNGIIGLLEIDEAHPDDLELIQANQKKMKISANHLLSLINDILQMSKLETGEIVLSHEVLNLNELSREILTIIEQRAAETGITLKYDKTTGRVEQENVYGSPLHLRQIFLNIYGNCIKYNKVGGMVETSCSCLGVKDRIVTYQWTIQDTGVGMSREFLKHIFDPFAQEKVDARSVYNGTGLGMAIVKSLIDKMNGTIEVSSEEGVGSVFVVTLPFEIAEEKPEKQETLPLNGEASIQGMHLLLAEDNELNAEIAKTLLGDEGAVITLADNGQKAIDLFESNPPGTFDAILMDVMMPVVDGLAAARMIRQLNREDAATIPIIAMTANAYDEDIRQCLDAGMNAHLSKPLQMELVIATLAKYKFHNRDKQSE